jgi:hypothetical protein
MATQVVTISEVETARRRDAIEAANASLRIEGMTVSARMKALNEEFIAGHVKADEVRRTVLGWYSSKQR